MDSPLARTRSTGLRRAATIAVAAAMTAGGALVAATPAVAAPSAGTIDGAELRWGASGEAGGGAFFGGCNFLSAGVAGDTGSSRLWSEADGFYSTSEGNVSIVKPDASGSLVAPTWATKCQTPEGTPVSAGSTSSLSHNEVVISNGTGSVAEDGSVEIAWDGSFSVVFYGGLTYWSASDPVLTVDAAGNGTLTATASGYGTSMEDMTQWVPIAPQEIVLADLSDVSVGDDGFTAVPDYLGVAVTTTGTPQPPQTPDNEAFWGSFPQSFVDFQLLTGQSSYWYASGGARDAAKPASPLAVSFELASEPEEPGEPEEPTDGQVIDVDVPEWVEPGTGAFGWAFASSDVVDLGTAVQQSGSFRAEGSLNDIVVTDTRAGGDGYDWSISGQAGDFVDGDQQFSGGYLGWTPAVIAGGASVFAGAPVTSTLSGGSGLSSSQVLASSTAAANATVGATLELVIPSSTPAGDYSSTLTITALS